MAKAKLDIPSQLPAGVTRPIYAGVGATDRAVEVFRGYVAAAQKTAQQRLEEMQRSVAEFDYQPQALREQVTARLQSLSKTVGEDADARRRFVEDRVAGLQAEALALPTRLQQLLDEQVATAGDTYDELIKRGETLVGRIRRQKSTQETVSSARTTVAKAKTTRTQASKAAKKTAKKTGAGARKTAGTARKSAAKSPAKSSATDAAGKVGD
jgi:hypothetical protein